MTTTVERPAVEDRTDTDLLEREQLRRVEERPTREVLPPRKAPPFVRWLAWIVGILLVAGTAGLVWWNVTTSEELVAPSIATIDPHQSPEVLRTQVLGPVAPSIATIDPHQSPEIVRIQVPEPVTSSSTGWSLQTLELLGSAPAQPNAGWSLQSLELLRSAPAQPSTGWSLQTLELLRSMPAYGD